MQRFLRRHGLLEESGDDAPRDDDSEAQRLLALAATTVSGSPPAGPDVRRKLPALGREAGATFATSYGPPSLKNASRTAQTASCASR